MPPLGDSRPVRSSQPDIHPALECLVARHVASPWRQPLHSASEAAFDRFLREWDGCRPLILDSGCGTGASSLALKRRYPAAHVVGVDRSAHRLARCPETPPAGVTLVRARLEDFWRLLRNHAIRPERHYLLYPNPWPKPGHVQRRWHGHPVFPVLVGLSSRLELRSNWRLYLEEFRQAARSLRAAPCSVVSFSPDRALTPFERKYRASGHALFRLTLNLETSK